MDMDNVKQVDSDDVDSIDQKLRDLFVNTEGNSSAADMLTGTPKDVHDWVWIVSTPFAPRDVSELDRDPATLLAKADAKAVVLDLAERCNRLGLRYHKNEREDYERRLVAIAAVLAERRRVARRWAWVGDLVDLSDLDRKFEFATSEINKLWAEVPCDRV